MVKPPSHMLMNAMKVSVKGAGTVLLSTVTSCAFAVVIESAAHRIQYRFFPHWYKDVKYAMGLPNLLNDQWHQDQMQRSQDGAKTDSCNEDDQIRSQMKDEVIQWDGSEQRIEISEDTRIGIINLEDQSFKENFREEPSYITQFQMYQDNLPSKKDLVELNQDVVLSCAMTG